MHFWGGKSRNLNIILFAKKVFFCYNNVMKFEAEIILFLQSHCSGLVIDIFRAITLFGSFIGFGIALMIVFFQNKKLSYAFVASFLVGTGMNWVLKTIIRRPRPFDFYSTILNLGAENGFSMPSGHACAAAIIAIFVAYAAIKYGKNMATRVCVPLASAVYFLAIIFSRMLLGAHYLTDVLAGGAEGAVIAILGITAFNLIMKKVANGKADKVKTDNK